MVNNHFGSGEEYELFRRATGLVGPLSPAQSALVSSVNSKQPYYFDVDKAATPFSNTSQNLSSTWIGNIKYLPYSNVAFVKLGNSEYYYGMTPRQLSTWLNSRSLGQYYNNFIKLND